VALKIESVEKKGYNDHHKYAYIREAELTTAARGLLADEGIWIIPAVTGLERTGSLVTLKIDFQVIDGASGETLHIPWFCEGSDAGDKGIAKALTGGNKALLSKLLQIPLVDGGGEYADSENTRLRARGASSNPQNERGPRTSRRRTLYHQGARAQTVEQGGIFVGHPTRWTQSQRRGLGYG